MADPFRNPCIQWTVLILSGALSPVTGFADDHHHGPRVIVCNGRVTGDPLRTALCHVYCANSGQGDYRVGPSANCCLTNPSACNISVECRQPDGSSKFTLGQNSYGDLLVQDENQFPGSLYKNSVFGAPQVNSSGLKIDPRNSTFEEESRRAPELGGTIQVVAETKLNITNTKTGNRTYSFVLTKGYVEYDATGSLYLVGTVGTQGKCGEQKDMLADLQAKTISAGGTIVPTTATSTVGVTGCSVKIKLPNSLISEVRAVDGHADAASATSSAGNVRGVSLVSKPFEVPGFGTLTIYGESTAFHNGVGPPPKKGKKANPYAPGVDPARDQSVELDVKNVFGTNATVWANSTSNPDHRDSNRPAGEVDLGVSYQFDNGLIAQAYMADAHKFKKVYGVQLAKPIGCGAYAQATVADTRCDQVSLIPCKSQMTGLLGINIKLDQPNSACGDQ